jgi:hypothetical protein
VGLSLKTTMFASTGIASLAVEAAPDVFHLPSAPYAWVTAAFVTGWYGRIAWHRIAEGRQPRGSSERERRRYQGTASLPEVHRNLSAGAVRGRAGAVRPSLGHLSFRQRLGIPATEFGSPIGRPAWRLPYRPVLYGTAEDSYLLLGPPRMGKTAHLATQVLDAAGAAVVTSTRVDLYNNTANARACKGPIDVLNADELGGIESTLRWSPVTGCENPTIAIQTAGYLVDASPGASGAKDAEMWEQQARIVLRCFLHAAALDGRTIFDVARWARNPIDAEPLNILAQHEDENEGNEFTVKGWAHELAQLRLKPPNFVSSVATVTSGALDWLADPRMAAAASPRPGEGFNAREFFGLVGTRNEGRPGTVYLIGADRPGASAAPYIAAFTAYLFEEAKRCASSMPGGRLDPPVTFALDEAPIICPIPLHRWVVESGGHGVTIIAGAQSISQLHDRWGENNGTTIWNSTTIKLIYGGYTKDDDLESLSLLCGSYDIHDENGKKVGSERLLPPGRIRLIKFGQALLIHRTTRPLIVKWLPVWKHAAYVPVKPPQPAEILPDRLTGRHRQALPEPATTAIPAQSNAPRALEGPNPVVAAVGQDGPPITPIGHADRATPDLNTGGPQPTHAGHTNQASARPQDAHVDA